MSVVYYDTSDNFHPYECDGKGKCRHCDRRVIYEGESVGLPTPNNVRDWVAIHDPATCSLCDPDYDYMPNPSWRGSKGDTR